MRSNRLSGAMLAAVSAVAALAGASPGIEYLSSFRLNRRDADDPPARGRRVARDRARDPDYRQAKTRELARLAWRQRVNEAARAWGASSPCCLYGSRMSRGISWDTLRPVRRRRWLVGHPAWAVSAVMSNLDAALAAPKPWSRPSAGADLGRDGWTEEQLEWWRSGVAIGMTRQASPSLRRKRRAAQRKRRTAR